MVRVQDVVLSATGVPVSGASVYVYTDSGYSVLASLYSDDGVSALGNPVTTGTDGTFSFFIADGRYYIKISGTGITTKTFGIREYADVTEANSADASWSTVNLNGIRLADAFAGATGTIQLDAAITDIGASKGAIIASAKTGTGAPTTQPNNIALLDLRQCTDIVPLLSGSQTTPQRPPVVLLQQKLGAYTPRTLTGTFTFTNGSTSVTGVGTAFTSELNLTTYAAATLIKLSSDADTVWARVASITDDTHLTLTTAYSGTSASGTGVQAICEHGLGIRAVLSGGTPDTQAVGEYSAINAVLARSAGQRGLYGANFNLVYSTPATATNGQVYGLEIDITNDSGVDDVTANNVYGINVVAGAAGTPKKTGTGIWVGATNGATAPWTRGVFISGASDVLLLLEDTSSAGGVPALQIIPKAVDASAQIGGMGTAGLNYQWKINNDGSAYFGGVNSDKAFSLNGATSTLTLNGKTATSTSVLTTGVSGDSVVRFALNANGSLNFGSGSESLDTQITRTNAAELTVTGGMILSKSIYPNITTTSSSGGITTFNCSEGNTIQTSLTENTTALFSLTRPGQHVTLIIVQHASSAKTFSWPSNCHGGMVISATLSSINTQTFVMSNSGTDLYAVNAGVTGLTGGTP